MQIDAYFVNAFKYAFKADDGRQLKGVSVRFIVQDGLAREEQIGFSIQKMSLPIETWEGLKQQDLRTFDRVKLTLAGFGRSARLVDVKKVKDNG